MDSLRQYSIRELRLARGLSQEGLAYRLGVSKNTLAAWEAMRYRPTWEHRLKLAQFFNVPVEAITVAPPGWKRRWLPIEVAGQEAWA